MEIEKHKNGDILELIARVLFFLSLLIVGVYIIAPNLMVDFWYDEVLSLEEFILVPLSKTVTDYQVPNNHIFFSILMNLWLKLNGIETFTQAANNITIVRALPLMFSVGTLMMVDTIEEKITKKKKSRLALIVLLGIIPFYNTLAQVRGYGLSMLLSSVIFYYGYQFYENPSKGKGALVALFTALLLYTIPSNLYAVLSALVVLGSIFLYQCNKYHFLIALRFNAIRLIAWLLLGVGLGVLLYLPVGDQVVNNEYVQSEGLFRWAIWSEMVQVFGYIFMPHYIIPILIVVGLAVANRKKVDLKLVAALAAIVILPFIFSFIRGGNPFDRTFLWICPFIAIIASILGSIIYHKWLKNTIVGYGDTYGKLIATAMVIGIGVANIDIEGKLNNGLKAAVKHQNIYYNYYQSNFNPHANLKLLKEEHYQEGTQVFLHEVDKQAMHGYLPVHNIKWQPFKDTIPYLNKYYIVTAFENKAIKEYKQYDTAFEFRRINKKLDFVNIIEAVRKK